MSIINWVNLSSHGDDRGSLVSIEGNSSIPFNIKRVYYLYATKKDVRRGLHAHKILKQIMVCISGSCNVLLDDGLNKEVAKLDSPDKGILVEGMIWRDMFDFSPDCVLLVVADQNYDEKDYIREYNRFLETIKDDKYS